MPTAGATITELEEKKIDALVTQGLFLNRSDFIRTAIRDLLEGFSIKEAIKRTRNGASSGQALGLTEMIPVEEAPTKIKETEK